MMFFRVSSLFVFLRQFPTGFSGRAISVLAVVLSALLAGCATGDYAYLTTISTGERIHIPLIKGAPAPAKKGNITIKFAGLIPNPNPEDKNLKYIFDLEDKSPVPAKSIVVEDVSDDHAFPMVEDLSPKYLDQRWLGFSKLLTKDDPALGWVVHLDSSTRVFQFTVTAADGSKTVLHQAWIVPNWAKVGMRQALGMK
jgi:hypothetical protein